MYKKKRKKPVKKPAKKPVKKPVKKPAKKPVKKPVKKPAKKPVKKPVRKAVPKRREPAKPAVRKVRQKAIKQRLRHTPEGERWRVIQRGHILIEARGYYITVNALVPAAWATSSTAVFEADPDSEQFHFVIWRTTVKSTMQEALDEYDKLLADQQLYSEANGVEYLVMSGEINMLHEDHSSYIIKQWTGDKPQRWLRRTARKLSKA